MSSLLTPLPDGLIKRAERVGVAVSATNREAQIVTIADDG